AIVELCTQLDREYLPRTLSKAEVDVDPTEYIEAVLDRGLKWLGALEVGESEDGVEVLRFRDRGADVVGLKEKADVDDREGPEQDEDGCLVVQPNYEVMLFLERAPLEILYYLYHIGERDKLADRVANFSLTAESVQWGYSHGLDAETVLEILENYSHSPIPDTVEFQLKDWERVHRQLKLYADGVLLRHSDADRLDLILGQLEHDWRGEEIESIRLGPSSVFIGEANPPGLDRIVEQEDALDIDYLGEIPPCLYFVDSLEIMVHPLECDLVTLTELKKIGEKLEGSTEESQFYELQIDAIEERWPERTLENAIEFLDQRTEGGIPPAQALRLKSLLQEPLQASVARERIVVELESEIVADHFERVPECEMIIEKRLGDRTFSVETQHLDELEEVFEELGVEARIFD
ncbi:MAG: helicase-associated domain-containing protein, partial [Bradymonadaceae bacterium]